MGTSVQCRPQERTLGMVMKEVDEDLAMFLEFRRNEKDMNNSEELDQQLGSEVDFSLLSNGISTMPANQDYIPNSENDCYLLVHLCCHVNRRSRVQAVEITSCRNARLLSPLQTPIPLPEVEERNTPENQIATNSSPTAQDCKIETDSSTAAAESKISSEQDIAQDIRRSVCGTLRPVLTRVSASSVNGIRSSSTKNKTGSVSDSPLAMSSNHSSNNINWSKPEDDNFGCERELSFPITQQHLEQ